MRNKKVKVALGFLVVAAALIAVQVRFPGGALPRVHAQAGALDDGSCSLATLNGRYGLTFHGFGTGGPVPAPISAFIPVAGVGTMTFDGSGNLSLLETVSFGGKVAPLTALGTYTVNADCTGTLQAVNATHLNLVIVHNGREILAINTDQGRVAAVNFEKQ
jgi:hypothetical protein